MGLVLALVALELLVWAESAGTPVDLANPGDAVSSVPTAGDPSIAVASAVPDGKPFTWVGQTPPGQLCAVLQ